MSKHSIQVLLRVYLLFAVLASCVSLVSAEEKPVKKLILPGESFLVDGRPAFILWPEESNRWQPQPWVMYGPTLPGLPDRHEKWMHEQFLNAGIAVVGIDVGEAYGSPQGQAQFSAFYEELTSNRGFAKKGCLLGRSRGGLLVGSWAISNPDKVAGLAGIYPVFDLRSYPGLKRAAPAYGMSPDELEEKLAELNPVAGMNVLAEASIPVCFIHGDVDKVVPIEANSAAVVRTYEQAGAENLTKLIVLKDQGHNYFPEFFRSKDLISFVIKTATSATQRNNTAGQIKH